MSETNKEIAISLGNAIGIDIFTLEYEILIVLLENGEVSHKNLIGSERYSFATLQRRFNLLREKGLIEPILDHTDRRRINFCLTEFARKTLDDELKFLSGWPDFNFSKFSNLEDFSDNLSQILGIPIFTDEYRILLCIYTNNEISVKSLIECSGLSKGNFYNKLNTLTEKQIIQTKRNKIDARKINIVLSEYVKSKIDHSHHALKCFFEGGPN